MQKKLTITLEDRVYQGLHAVVGRRRISRFIESLVRPYVIGKDLDTAYRQMAREEIHYFAIFLSPHSGNETKKVVDLRSAGASHRPRIFQQRDAFGDSELLFRDAR